MVYLSTDALDAVTLDAETILGHTELLRLLLAFDLIAQALDAGESLERVGRPVGVFRQAVVRNVFDIKDL